MRPLSRAFAVARLSASLLLGAALFPAAARAQAVPLNPTRIEAVSPYSLVDGSKLYYHWSGATGTTVDTAAGFRKVDGEDLLLIRVISSELVAGAGQTLFVSVVMNDASPNGTQRYLMPIYGAAQLNSEAETVAVCGDATCIGGRYRLQPGDDDDAALPASSSPTVYYGARYTSGQALTLALQLNQLCAHLDEIGVSTTATVKYCNPSDATNTFNPDFSADGRSVSLSVIFAGIPSNASSNATILRFEGTTQTRNLTLNFGTDAPALSGCSSGTPANDWYRPGDGAITVNAGVLNASPGSDNPSAGSADNTPIEALLVLAQPSTTSLVTDVATMRTGNAIFQSISDEGSTSVRGFTNSTAADLVGDTASNKYSVQILARNAAGVLSNTPAACVQNNVRTAAIDQFLSDDTRCFVATAAFGSVDAAPVRLLRRFRDRVLRRLPGGDALVEFYYERSPRLAAAVRGNPALRLPSLTWLLPLQGLAWLTLQPLLLAALGTLGMALVLGAARTRAAVRR